MLNSRNKWNGNKRWIILGKKKIFLSICIIFLTHKFPNYQWCRSQVLVCLNEILNIHPHPFLSCCQPYFNLLLILLSIKYILILRLSGLSVLHVTLMGSERGIVEKMGQLLFITQLPGWLIHCLHHHSPKYCFTEWWIMFQGKNQ